MRCRGEWNAAQQQRVEQIGADYQTLAIDAIR